MEEEKPIEESKASVHIYPWSAYRYSKDEDKKTESSEHITGNNYVFKDQDGKTIGEIIFLDEGTIDDRSWMRAGTAIKTRKEEPKE